MNHKLKKNQIILLNNIGKTLIFYKIIYFNKKHLFNLISKLTTY